MNNYADTGLELVRAIDGAIVPPQPTSCENWHSGDASSEISKKRIQSSNPAIFVRRQNATHFDSVFGSQSFPG